VGQAEPKSLKCPFCDEPLTYHPPTKTGGKDCFWECLGCGCEVWPYDENAEKEIRRAMGTDVIRGARKKGYGRRRRKWKRQKPGEKLRPWYQR